MVGAIPVDVRYDNGLVKIKTIDEDEIPLLVNGYILKFYKKSMKREDFINLLHNQKINVVSSINPPKPF
jgi:hypothetical protein